MSNSDKKEVYVLATLWFLWVIACFLLGVLIGISGCSHPATTPPQQKTTEHKTGPCCTQKSEAVNGCVKQENGMWVREECRCPKCKGACGAGSCPCQGLECADGCKCWCPAR